MPVHDAEPGDIYADEHGKLWRIIAICHQPTVEAEEVEGRLHDPNAPPPQYAAQAMGLGMAGFSPRATIIKQRRSGGTAGLMWTGWKRIWRNDWRSKQPPMPDHGSDQETGQGPV